MIADLQTIQLVVGIIVAFLMILYWNEGTPLFSCVTPLKQFKLARGTDGFAPVSCTRYLRQDDSKQFGIMQLQLASNPQYRQIVLYSIDRIAAGGAATLLVYDQTL